MIRPLTIGARKTLNRVEAIEQYIFFDCEQKTLTDSTFWLNALYEDRIPLPTESPFSTKDLKDTVRTAFLGWFATLTDKDGRAVYMF